MDLVVDANILISALIKEGAAAKLLFSDKFHLFTAEFILMEVAKHKSELLEKTERTVEDFEKVLDIFQKRISLIPLDELVPFIELADKISPDPDDVPYFALALKLNCSIWSNDKDLKENQTVVRVYPTHELMRL